MSSGSSDGATRLSPVRSAQRSSDEGQVMNENSGNSNHKTPKDHDFEIPRTNIDDILSEVSLSSDNKSHINSPNKTLSNEPVSCYSSQHIVTLSEKAGIQVPIQSSPLDYSSKESGNGKGAIRPVETAHMNQLKENSSAVFNGSSLENPDAGLKCMYPTGVESDSDSDSTPDSSVIVNKMAFSSGSLHEPSSDEAEVEFCSCDAQQPAAGGHSHLSQSPNGSSPFQHASSQNTNLDQTSVLEVLSDVSLTNKENFVTTTQCSQLSQSLGIFSAEQPCQSSNGTIPVSSVDHHISSAIEPCDKVKACVASSPGSLSIYRSPSPLDTASVTQCSTADLQADTSLSSDLLKNLNMQIVHSPSMESEISHSSTGRSDTRLPASMINKEKVMECRTNLNRNASSLLTKTSGLKLFDNSECPVWSSNFKLQFEAQTGPNTSAPKLKGLSIKSKSKEEEPLQKPPATMSSVLKTNNQPDMNGRLALSRVSDRRQVIAEHSPSGGTLQTVQLAKEKDMHLGSKAKAKSRPPATQRTFIEVRLSSLSDTSSLVMGHNETLNSKDSKPTQRYTDARLASKRFAANSTIEETNGMVSNTVLSSLCSAKKTTTSYGSKSSTIVETSETLKSSTSRLYIKTAERQSLSTDTSLSANYNPFSVRHKIKSFENLANFDKPKAKSSDIQSYALAYRASLNQRIAGYMGLVNSFDCQARQRSFSSYVQNLIPTAPCSPILRKSPSTIALINLELPQSSCNTAPLTEYNPEAGVPYGTAPQTPQVLRRKHGKLSRSRVRQLRALSMPELEKLCTEDFSRGHGTVVDETESGIQANILTKATVTESSPPSSPLTKGDANRVSRGDLGSTDEAPQETPGTHGQQPGWSISLKELATSPVSQRKLQTLLSSQTVKLHVSALLQDAKALPEVDDNSHLIVLNKEEGSGLGFSIAGGDDIELKAITVHRVFTKGAASLEGTIQKGDSILSINGTSLEGKTHGEALSCLHQARMSNQAFVVIWRDKDRPDSACQPKRMCSAKKKSLGAAAVVDVGPDGAFTSELHKSSAGLGFSLEGGKS